jgi:hypothetical protein
MQKKKKGKHQLEYQNLKKSHFSRLGNFGVVGLWSLITPKEASLKIEDAD